MKKKMVRYTHETLPPLTEKQRANLAALAARPDSEIDYSDIPPLPDDVLRVFRNSCGSFLANFANFETGRSPVKYNMCAALSAAPRYLL